MPIEDFLNEGTPLKKDVYEKLRNQNLQIHIKFSLSELLSVILVSELCIGVCFQRGLKVI